MKNVFYKPTESENLVTHDTDFYSTIFHVKGKDGHDFFFKHIKVRETRKLRRQ